ncbi:MAG: glycosyltransferase family 4 protein [Bacteroidetes bacterium]|nr:glycosyltransferase family 4 protein [Bacteroidota bacterium]
MSDLKKGKVLYFYTAESPFIEKDIVIINTNYSVKPFLFNVYDKKKILFIVIKQGLFLFRNLFSAKAVVCQFAGLHSVLPVLFAKLFFKRSVIVSGGTDCVSFPSINYGNFANKNNARLTRFSFKNASLILPVHQTLVYCDYIYQNNDYKHQGIKQFIPELKTKTSVIHNGYDNIYWHFNLNTKLKKTFITVLGHVNSKFTLQLKGIDLFVEIARKFPEASFTIVGGADLKLENKPVNLTLLSNIWGTKMNDVFSAHRFYVQLSISEGFPNALSEAMLCECVPIVSSVGGMPDIVDDCGYILKHKSIDELFVLMNNALNNTNLDNLGKKARERIKDNYTFEKRRDKLLAELEELI